MDTRAVAHLSKGLVQVSDDQRALDQRVIGHHVNLAGQAAGRDVHHGSKRRLGDQGAVLPTGEADNPGVILRRRVASPRALGAPHLNAG